MTEFLIRDYPFRLLRMEGQRAVVEDVLSWQEMRITEELARYLPGGESAIQRHTDSTHKGVSVDMTRGEDMPDNGRCLVICADVLKWASEYNGPKFHAMLCDPPYHLSDMSKRYGRNGASDRPGGPFKGTNKGFMNQTWDGGDIAFQPETWAALAEHLHPGAFIMAFGGSRTYHRLACAIEDAGFIIHPAISWVYGSGFPKATNISKAVDRDAGAKQEVVGRNPLAKKQTGQRGTVALAGDRNPNDILTAPATDLAKTWHGHRYGGQALKPAAEFICVAQKPYEGRPIDDITRTGAGALNIDAGRVGGEWSNPSSGQGAGRNGANSNGSAFGVGMGGIVADANELGRWPSNLVIDEDCAELLDAQSGLLTSGNNPAKRSADMHRNVYGGWKGEQVLVRRPTDSGYASRFFFNVDRSLEDAEPFFYCAKADRDERNAGLDHLPKKPLNWSSGEQSPGTFQAEGTDRSARNPHPCVKPISLCKYLAGLLLPPDAYAPRRILVPFAGSGSEAIAAMLAGWEEVVGIEGSEQYAEIAQARIEWWSHNHFGMFAEAGLRDLKEQKPAQTQERLPL